MYGWAIDATPNTQTIQIRRDTQEAWYRENPVLAEGEMGYDLTKHRLRIGDGVTRWLELPYLDFIQPTV